MNRASGMGCTPLHWACRGGWVNVVEALTAAQADVNRSTSMGCTPLHWGAREGQVRECVVVLVRVQVWIRHEINAVCLQSVLGAILKRV